jgi:hypothetical protein
MEALWPKWARQEPLKILWINAVIHEKTPINGAFKG